MSSLDDFNHHRPLLFSIAYRMLGTVTDAEDMVQETFLLDIGFTLSIHVVWPRQTVS